MASSIIEIFSSFLNRFSLYFWLLLFFIVLISASYYAYTVYLTPTLKLTNEKDVSNMPEGNGKKVLIYYFFTTWCPHCTKASPIWDAFSTDNNNTMKNGYIIECIKIDCTDDSSNSATMIEKYHVSGFPTIKMIKDNDTIDFDAEISQNSLNTFVTDMIVNK